MKKKEKKEEPEGIPASITRREFNSFFLLGSLLGFLRKKTVLRQPDKEAMFWKKTDA